jgi:hypothetical protein
MIVHAGLILSALASVGIPRYTIGFWPPMAVGVAFFAALVLRADIASLKRRGAP